MGSQAKCFGATYHPLLGENILKNQQHCCCKGSEKSQNRNTYKLCKGGSVKKHRKAAQQGYPIEELFTVL